MKGTLKNLFYIRNVIIGASVLFFLFTKELEANCFKLFKNIFSIIFLELCSHKIGFINVYHRNYHLVGIVRVFYN